LLEDLCEDQADEVLEGSVHQFPATAFSITPSFIRYHMQYLERLHRADHTDTA
jgi:hypothetical protein